MKSPSHITHESDAELLRRLQALSPIDKVVLGCCRLARRMAIASSDKGSPFSMLDILVSHQASNSVWWQSLLMGLAKLHFHFQAGYDCQSIIAFLLHTPEEQFHEPWLLAQQKAAGTPSLALHDKPAEYTCCDCGRAFHTYASLRSHQLRSSGNCSFIKNPVTFDSSIDNKGDTPACRWCNASFKWWGQLKKHISLGQCPRAQARAEHLLHLDERHLPRGEHLPPRERRLPGEHLPPAEHLPRARAELHLHKDLRMHCVMCGRWCKFARSLTYHLRCEHGEAFAHGKMRYKSLDFRALGPSRQCSLCKLVGSTANIRNHIKAHCVVILQRCMAQLADPLSPHSLRPEAPVSTQQAGQDFDDDIFSLHADGCAAQGRLGHVVRTGSEEIKIRRRIRFKSRDPRTASSISSTLIQQASSQSCTQRRRRTRKSRPPDPESCSTGVAATRSSAGSWACMRISAALGEERVSHDSAATRADQQGMERCNGESISEHSRTLACATLQGCDGDTDDAHGRVAESNEGQEASSCAALLERLGEALLRGMGSGNRDIEAGQWGTRADVGSIREIDGRNVSPCMRRGNRKIEDPQAIDNTESNNYPPCSPGLQCNLTSRQASLGNYASIDRSHMLEACGRLSSCGEGQDATPRGSDQATALSQRLLGREEGPSVRLSNPNGTSCYLNALAFAIWWLWHLHALSVPALPQAIRNAISVLEDGVWDLTTHTDWLTLLQGWVLGAQEDAHELFGYLLNRHHIAQFWGEMQTLHLAYDSFEDSRFCTLGIPVPENGEMLALHDLVHSWWQQQLEEGHRCCFLSLPQVLVLHLLRFRYVANRPSRNLTPVMLGRFSFPVAATELVTHTEYAPQAVIMHHGETPHSGHYTSFLYHSAGNGWYMDDARSPRAMSATSSVIMRQSYIVMLRKIA